MTTPRKTAKEISDVMITQLEVAFNQSIPLAPKAFNRVLAKACGLVFVALMQFAQFILLQMFVKYASNKPFTVGGITLTPLKRWGDLVGIFQGTGARWEGTVTFNVLSPSGVLLSGSQIIDTATEEMYLTIGDTTITGATISPTVRAVNYSEAADLDVGDAVELVSAPAQLSKEGTVATDTVQGADPETTEAFRANILQFFAARPQGGAYADYWEWGSEVDGVANIYPYAGGTDGVPTSGPGQVDVYVKSDSGDGTASASLLSSVAANIEQTAATGLANRRPVNDYVNTVSIYLDTVDVTISGLPPSLDTPEIRADIEEALDNYIAGRENYIVGLTVAPRKDFITSTEAGGVAGRVAAANGATITGVALSRSYEGGSFDVSSLREGEQVRSGTYSWT
jgi:uncharacterized phage protein gp47/JayE